LRQEPLRQAYGVRGRSSVKQAPLPGVLLALIAPSICSISQRQTKSPSPVPPQSFLVVKQGVKTWGRSVTAMPGPLFWTATGTRS